MANRQAPPLQLRMVESILKTSRTCFDIIRPALNPKRPDPIIFCFAVYIFSRLDLEIVRVKLGDGLREILYDAFVDELVKTFRGISKDALLPIVNEELDSLGNIYRTKSGGDAFVEMHNYLEVLLGAASIQKRPTLWRLGKDPLVLIGFDKVMVIRATLGEIEKTVIIPGVKLYLDVLAGKDTKEQSEIKGVEAVKKFFRDTKEWQVLPQSVTDKIAERFADQQGQAFIELEKVVMLNDLIETKFKPICDEYAGTDSILFFLLALCMILG